MELLLFKPLIDGEIKLQQLDLPDAEALFKLTDKNRDYLRKWLPWLDSTKTVEDTKKFIQDSMDKASLERAADFGVYYRDSLVGVIGYHAIDKTNKKTTVGYWLDKDSQGSGIMTKATKILIEFAFRVLKLNRIQINCAIGNDKSCGIPKRLGFTKEGIARQAEWIYDHFVDWELYSLLLSDWNKSKN